MMQVQLEDLILTVDSTTAEQLKDPNYAARYLAMVRRQLSPKEPPSNKEPSNLHNVFNYSNHSNVSETSLLWKSAKCPTNKDHEATLELLKIRKELHDKFNDKKTPNAELWQQIATHLNNNGFFVGERLEGREKVRQKTANLQSSYVKYCDKRRQTGEGNVKVPKYYEELDLIFGDTHKANPVLLIDSTMTTKEAIHCEDAPTPSTSTKSSPPTPQLNTPNTSELISTPTTTQLMSSTPTNRFKNVKRTLKPKTATRAALEEMINLQRENQAQRKKDFDQIAGLIREESRQRHEQMMALIKQMGQNKCSKTKRKREDSSDEEN